MAHAFVPRSTMAVGSAENEFASSLCLHSTTKFTTTNETMLLFPAAAAAPLAILLLQSAANGQATDSTKNATATVYCVSNAPALSWPSVSLPIVEQVDMPAGTQLVVGDGGPNGSMLLVSLTVPADAAFHTAVLRFGSDTSGLEFQQQPNATAAATTILDCGNRATGLTASNAWVLQGTLNAMRTAQLEKWLPLQAELTVVLQNDETAIRFAYEKVMLEAWMWEDTVRATTNMDYAVTESSPTSMAIEWGRDVEVVEEANISSLDRSPSWKTLGRLPAAMVLWFFSLW